MTPAALCIAVFATGFLAFAAIGLRDSIVRFRGEVRGQETFRNIHNGVNAPKRSSNHV